MSTSHVQDGRRRLDERTLEYDTVRSDVQELEIVSFGQGTMMLVEQRVIFQAGVADDVVVPGIRLLFVIGIGDVLDAQMLAV